MYMAQVSKNILALTSEKMLNFFTRSKIFHRSELLGYLDFARAHHTFILYALSITPQRRRLNLQPF